MRDGFRYMADDWRRLAVKAAKQDARANTLDEP